jgi:hypothetical protein
MSQKSQDATSHHHAPEAHKPRGDRDPDPKATLTDPPGGTQLTPPPPSRGGGDDNKQR